MEIGTSIRGTPGLPNFAVSKLRSRPAVPGIDLPFSRHWKNAHGAAGGGIAPKLEPFSDFADLSKNADQGSLCVGITFKRRADAADSTSEARMLIFRQRPVCGFEDQRKHDATTTQNLYWQRE